MVLGYDHSNKKGDSGEQMYLRPGPFRWPRGHIEAIRSSLPDKGGPGLSQKATKCRHRWSTHYVLPRRLLGRQQTKRRCKMCQLCRPFRFLITWGLLTELSKRICLESCFFIVYQFLCIVCKYFVPRGVAIYRLSVGQCLVFCWFLSGRTQDMRLARCSLP